jgi:DNA polymerase-3 subunit beta
MENTKKESLVEIKVAQGDLLNAIVQVSRVIKIQAQLPILSCVVFEYGDNLLVVSGTDMQAGMRSEVRCKCSGKGKIALVMSQFLEFFQNLSKQECTLDVSEDKVVVKQGQSRAVFALTPIVDYPDVVFEESKKNIEVDGEAFSEALKKAGFAVAQEDSRPVLTGLLMQQVKEKLRLVGTDGYRLSVVEIDANEELGRDMLVPTKILKSVLKGFDSEKIKLGFDGANSQVWFKGKENFVFIRLLQGDFPDYGKIMPKSFQTKIIVRKEDLLQAVKQLAVFAKMNANIINWSVGKNLELATQAQSGGEGAVSVDVEFEGEEVKLAFNFRYLLDYLQVINGEDIEVQLNGPLAPVLFRSKEDEGFEHVIMPVKTSE